MTPQARRRLIPVIVLFLAGSILSVLIFGPKRPDKPKAQPIPAAPKEVVEQKPSSTVEETTVQAPEVANENLKPFEVLRLVTHEESTSEVVLGSLSDYTNWKMEVAFTHSGASISSIRFSDIFETVDGKLAWNKFREHGGVQPSIEELYLLATTFKSDSFSAPVLSAYQVVINDQKLNLASANVWKQTDVTENSVSYEATVVDTNGNNIAIIYRTWSLSGGYGLHVQQGIKNLTGQQRTVQWLQYGPPSLTVDRSRYMDRRRFRFGWELSDEFDPDHAAPIQSNDFLYEFADTTKDIETTLWPTDETIENGFKLSWFASTNRYFSLAVMPNINNEGVGNRIITDKIASVRCRVWGESPNEYITTGLYSPAKIVEGGKTYDITMDVYAGPLQRSVLDNEQPYIALNMRDHGAISNVLHVRALHISMVS